MATIAGLTFSDDGVLTITLRGGGVPATAITLGGWAISQAGEAYITYDAVDADAVKLGGLSFTPDGALYATTDAPSGATMIGGRAVQSDGALHVIVGAPSGDDQAIGGWMTTNSGQAYVSA